MINTLNESHLHKTLKTLYSLENEGCQTEAKAGKYIADILTKEGNVIEIQTGSLAHLSAKIMYFLEQKRTVTVVYPLVRQKYIQTEDGKGKILRKRKSPVKKNIYSLFRELTSLTPFLLKKNFYLHVVEVTVTETRAATEEKVQSANGRRHFLRNWVKTGKNLDSIEKKHVFHGKKSYTELLPKSLDKEFSVTDIYSAVKLTESGVKRNEISLMVWVLCKAGLLEFTGKKGRSNYYTKN
ncbi:MAG: hypothetical protein J5817_02035 [Treponema sp.]|nr:hypothetical protein [Treponema sp.]